MNTLDIKTILKAHPELTANGMDSAPRYRQYLFESEEQCSLAEQYLMLCGKRKTINGKFTSYGLKHTAEIFMGKYISNGAFICAALHLGFKIQKNRLNPCLNISSKLPRGRFTHY